MRHLLVMLCFSAFFYNVFALNSDGMALLSLMKHWESVPPLINSSWNAFDSTPCSWVGIQCNQAHNVVILNLTGYPISGSLGPEIGHLSHLQTLVFSLDDLTGEIPQELGNCTHLEFLDLSENKFSGKIPHSLKKLQKLRKLILYSNVLIGEIPESLFAIPHLEHVFLHNNILSGPIPESVGNLSDLSRLYLYYNNLSSTIPSSIGNCTKLEELILTGNRIHGVLPESLTNLENLAYLDLSENDLKGIIPLGSGKCENLHFLDLSFNIFSGGIPFDLGNCSGLMNLFIIKSNLQGSIPSSLGLLLGLSVLVLTDNNLSGTIPPEIGNCKSLKTLQLQINQLEGEIPRELGNLSQLQDLSLHSNRLTGEIPLSIWKISSLETIYLNDNILSGELPTEMADHKRLKNITLSSNYLSGNIPKKLGIRSSLVELQLANNIFTGNIPPNLCHGKQLVFLAMGQNKLQGSIPVDIGRCPTLERLSLGGNNLNGDLPKFETCSYLSFVNISNNQINGKIPSSLGNCINLSDINIFLNKLNGQIPSELGRLVNLERINLAHNNLEGPLPHQLSGCNKMLYFDVGFNSLNGSFPSSLRNWTKLTSLILRENQFSGGIPNFLSEFEKLLQLETGGNLFGGRIPRSIGALQKLTYGLNLSANGLVGEIPLEIVKLKMLQELDISQNSLTGGIEVLDELSSLVQINISYNSFEGLVPRSLLKFFNSSPSSFWGNPELCVSCLPADGLNCYKNSNLKPCDDKSTSHKRAPSKIKVVIISLGSSLFFTVLSLGLFYILVLKRSNVRSSAVLKKVMKATKNLDDRYLIGRGAHGVVYQVQLGPDKIFALKKFQFAENERQTESMINEIQTLAKIRHRNLVKLKNFWFRKEYGLILYNYMPNGSLHDILHGMNSPPLLKWSVRYKIAGGVAHGLSYLHHDCDPIIVHRDIKPTNILLDSDLEPHIADFGISKLLDQSSASTSSVAVPGTFGYIAPENAYTTVKSTKSDVYSYGVILLELLTRKEVLDSSFLESQDMMGWVSNVWEQAGDVTKIVDQGLASELASDPNIREQVNQMLLVALRCTEKDPVKRPTMRDVEKQLIFE